MHFHNGNKLNENKKRVRMILAKTKTVSKKSSSKKSTVKKATKKRAITKKKVFIEIPEDKFFVLLNGDKIKHYVELADKLEHLEQHIINHHIRPDRHDFAKWIKDVFNEEELAKKLSKIKEREKMRSLIYKHIIKKYLK